MNNGPAETKVPPRYSRQILFDPIGEKGQERLMASKVALIGCGALGTVQASLLVRAGVGAVRIIDRDFVEESNLQRQILFDERDVKESLPKAVAAQSKLSAVNSLVKVEGLVEDLNASTIERLLGGYDLILDATDNFEVRYLINDYAVKHGIPWVYGACVSSNGLAFPIVPGKTSCLKCVFDSAPPPEMSPSCDMAGVIGPIVGVVASIQVAEAMKILAGCDTALSPYMTVIDLWQNQFLKMSLPPKRDDCPCCGLKEFSYLNGKSGAEPVTLCGRNSVQIVSRSKVDLEVLAKQLSSLGKVEANRFLVRAFIDNLQLTVFKDGRVIVGGTRDPKVAKSAVAKYVGA